MNIVLALCRNDRANNVYFKTRDVEKVVTNNNSSAVMVNWMANCCTVAVISVHILSLVDSCN